jgi:hypothetical protein
VKNEPDKRRYLDSYYQTVAESGFSKLWQRKIVNDYQTFGTEYTKTASIHQQMTYSGIKNKMIAIFGCFISLYIQNNATEANHRFTE